SRDAAARRAVGRRRAASPARDVEPAEGPLPRPRAARARPAGLRDEPPVDDARAVGLRRRGRHPHARLATRAPRVDGAARSRAVATAARVDQAPGALTRRRKRSPVRPPRRLRSRPMPPLITREEALRL